MARGRFISESVAKDLRLNSLSVEAQLVYLMTIPHLDRDGLIEGDTDILYGTVCPKRRQFIDEIGEFIQEWVQAGLVIAYDSDAGPVLWFKGFAKNQLGLRYDRETPSKFPPPPGYERCDDGLSPVKPPPPPSDNEQDAPPVDDSIRQESGTLPDASDNCSAQWQEQVQEQDQVEVEVEVEAEESALPAATKHDVDVARVWAKWDANMPGTKSQVITDSVNSLLDDYSAAEIEEAITIACKRNRRTLSYIQGILAKGAFSEAPTNGNGNGNGNGKPSGLDVFKDYARRNGVAI
jgi:hypothetical protein